MKPIRRRVYAYASQVVGAVVGRGQAITYPKKTPSVQFSAVMFSNCMRDEGWEPRLQADGMYFPTLDFFIRIGDLATCNIQDAPGPLKNDMRRCLRAQGLCND